MRQKLCATLGVGLVAGLLATAGAAGSPALAKGSRACGDREPSDERRAGPSAERRAGLSSEWRAGPSVARRDLVGPTAYTVKKAGVVYRSGPGTKYRQLGTLKQGGIIAGTGYTSGGWSQFYLTVGGTAWVASTYLTRARFPIYRVAAASGLNLRSGPGLNYRIVGALKQGIIVPGTGRNVNGWLQLQLVNGALPWASSRYLQLLPKSETYGAPGEPNEDGPVDPPLAGDHCSDDDS